MDNNKIWRGIYRLSHQEHRKACLISAFYFYLHFSTSVIDRFFTLNYQYNNIRIFCYKWFLQVKVADKQLPTKNDADEKLRGNA